MTISELREQAAQMGYVLAKKPCYQCSCYSQYPNEMHKFKNGRWKCVDKYKPMKWKRKYNHQPVTKCVLKERSDKE